ncbi:serine/threonine-protein kinase nek1 [Plakobranchus ocellatus]|uniref:non-specific serine/threonine protein kinase n=1 Tax=Plakobranchus ocellatus TaxID=259542 RepID=A0AAV4CCJ8_9GAST|nr:serine/threonine-protein kinase nek1 [Plakobranchus ocellatus]
MYKILTELGQGAFGHVYLLQTPNFEKYALKITKRKNLKEAEIMKYLCHAHLVKCFDFIAKSLHLYLVIEYCSQGTLNDLVKQQQKHIPEKILLKMLCQLSDVLRYLCAKNVIHRDLKPDNIFLDKHKNIKVGDVGVARVLEHTSEEVSTVVGAWVYMSPEMHAGKKYTFKTDIWSLGCCMHELMTLQRTFFSLKDLFERRVCIMINLPDLPPFCTVTAI